MTHDELRDLIASISLERASIPTTIEVEPNSDPWIPSAMVVYTMRVRERDTGIATTVRSTVSIYLEGQDRARVARMVLRGLVEGYAHEAREAFKVDGVRIDDPHAGERPGLKG